MSTTDPDPIRTAGDKYDAAVRDAFAKIPRETGTRATWKLARPALAAAREQLEHDVAAARAGHDDAARTVAAHYAAGIDLDQLAAHHDDVSASLQSDAQTAAGRSYAQSYADVSASLIADLREDQAVARAQSEAACTKPEGTPHPDPVLAARGWQVNRGIYQRTRKATADRTADREAC